MSAFLLFQGLPHTLQGHFQRANGGAHIVCAGGHIEKIAVRAHGNVDPVHLLLNKLAHGRIHPTHGRAEDLAEQLQRLARVLLGHFRATGGSLINEPPLPVLQVDAFHPTVSFNRCITATWPAVWLNSAISAQLRKPIAPAKRTAIADWLGLSAPSPEGGRPVT